MNTLKVALVQMQVVDLKEQNLQRAEALIKKAVNKGAKLIVLPEMFNCPYHSTLFPKYAEKEGEYSYQCLSRIARENSVFLVGGSIPEIDDAQRIYNTCYIFDPMGKQIGKHRKMHLFDIDIEDGQYFKESNTLSAGNTITTFETPYGKMGVMICYDFRFPELSRLLVEEGAKFILVPGAFNMTTGPAHWELLFRSRALDNQVYTLGIAPARNCNASYISYGNSIIADPWGNVVNKLGAEEDVLIEELDLNRIEKIRSELPLLKHRRSDLYTCMKK